MLGIERHDERKVDSRACLYAYVTKSGGQEKSQLREGR